ncbi:MAG: DUF5107 domain-containing protein [Verrucomicrobiota bacterium]
MTTELRIEKYPIMAAILGEDSPLPPLHPPVSFAAGMKVDASVPDAARTYLGYGLDTGCLPYGLQDQYDRTRQAAVLKVAVLENEILKAVFLLEYGGRLWSLIHKPSGRELLYVNPVLQPANLAIRNAWFSGGVEWNAALRGHSPHTCSPLFAARVAGQDGSPILRFWEWERLRGVPYQIDFRLPEKSPWLFVSVRIINPQAGVIPMYWWSNIALCERADMRVLVPAEAAYLFDYSKVMTRVPVPYDERKADISYATNLNKAADYFYDIAKRPCPWIAVLDAAGQGLMHVSTARLRGRKLFAWGMGAGGRNWQNFLSDGQAPYIEIQAGLAQTQYECYPMPAGAQWSWLEAYGLMSAKASKVHAKNWRTACREVEDCLAATLPYAALEAEQRRSAMDIDKPPVEILQRGSGWGNLESRRRKLFGEKSFYPNALVFDEASLGKAQVPWQALLEKGALPEQDPRMSPGGWMTQAEWRRLLRNAVEKRRGDHWLSWLHLGVMEYDQGRKEAARQAWEKSLDRARTAWALRNLAVLAGEEQKSAQAADLYLEAIERAPSLIALLLEGIQTWLEAGRTQQALDFIKKQSAPIRSHGRIRTLEASALEKLGEFDKAETILTSGLEVAGLREGEIALSDLWFSIQEKRLAGKSGCRINAELKKRVRCESVLPAHLDFRMAESNVAG